MAGVIKAEDEAKMARMVFRVSRSRAVPSFYNIEKRVYYYKIF